MVNHQDIARYVGVSQATVSKVLSNKSNNIGISQKTRQAVIEAAKILGYNKDKVASNLIHLVEKSIAILVEHIANPFCSVILNGIEQELVNTDYQFMFASSNGKAEISTSMIELLTRRYTTGFILMPFYESNTSQKVHLYLKNRGIPFVQTNYYNLPGKNDAPLISTDNYEIFRKLTEHLINLGHKRIALVYTSPMYSSNADRVRGFNDAMGDAGLKVHPSLLVDLPRHEYFDVDTKKQLLRRWLAMKQPPTAIMTIKDDCAVQFIRILEQMNLRVPEDMAVTGFDDIYHFIPKYYHEAYKYLTTVRQNLPEIGRQAVRRLIDEIEGDSKRQLPLEVFVPAEIIVRGSCGARIHDRSTFNENLQLEGLGTGFLMH